MVGIWGNIGADLVKLPRLLCTLYMTGTWSWLSTYLVVIVCVQVCPDSHSFLYRPGDLISFGCLNSAFTPVLVFGLSIRPPAMENTFILHRQVDKVFMFTCNIVPVSIGLHIRVSQNQHTGRFLKLDYALQITIHKWDTMWLGWSLKIQRGVTAFQSIHYPKV